MDNIVIQNAQTHNLNNINLTIPRNKLIVITGVSGSGKSSLAFDTLYAEGQRRYVESLSSYARQFLSMMQKPDVEYISGLSPAIAIEQKATSHNPRSTVGTVTEIYDYLRVLYARIGQPKCPKHQIKLNAQTVSEMVDHAFKLPSNNKVMILSPIVIDRKGHYKNLMEKMHNQGFLRARIDGKVHELESPPKLKATQKHSIEIIVDRLKIKPHQQQRLAESFETALNLSDGIAKLYNMESNNPSKADIIFSSKHACPYCQFSLNELSPRLFSFNSPLGACNECDGLGHKRYFDPHKIVPDSSLSINGGALSKWNMHNKYRYEINALAYHYQFSLNTPFKNLPSYIKDIIFYGSKDQYIEFTSIHRGIAKKQNKPFEGIINYLNRKYRETDSNIIREEMTRLMSQLPCPDCQGARLNQIALNIYIKDKNIYDFTKQSIESALAWLNTLELEGKNKIIAERLFQEINARLNFLNNVGLNYLNLSRQADTLSGGEAQRIRLASQIGSGLVGVMYVLDEPSIGLHQKDNQRLLNMLHYLRDLGNTVIMVEHDENAIKQADHIIDLRPGAGKKGGKVIAEGDFETIKANQYSLTGQYLSGKRQIKIPTERKKPLQDYYLIINGARGHNLKNISLKLPLGLITCVTGVSGSGKSTLINQTLYPLASNLLNKNTTVTIAEYESYKGFDHIDKVINIDQSPIGRTPRSNPATYTGIFTTIRELFANTQESKTRGYLPGRFSFNLKGGRCEYCQGDGVIKVEMHFLPDLHVICDICQGKRYNRETLEVKYKGKTIDEVLAMSVSEAFEFFYSVPSIKKRLQTLIDVGLSYITLGQNAVTLSGGEAQRVKLAKELAKQSSGQTLYLLDEPTTGLHFYDIENLLNVIHQLRDQGNTIVIIEHNMDIMKSSDWIIDLGLEGGEYGGKIVAQGRPESVCQNKSSYTAFYLYDVLSRN
jgi:excinuclease ABC subunit A